MNFDRKKDCYEAYQYQKIHMDNLHYRMFACSCEHIFIPVHFANGIADDYGRKIQIFLFPILQVLITFLTGREKVKYFLTHSKTFLTDIQFNWMIDGVLLLVMFAEIWVIHASFA